MAWELLEKRSVGGLRGRDRGWDGIPALAINKTTISFSEEFHRLYIEPVNSSQIMISFDTDASRVGIKVVGRGDEDAGNYRLRRSTSKGGKVSKTLQVSTGKHIADKFPHAVGHCYRCHMNSNGLIEATLRESNQIT